MPEIIFAHFRRRINSQKSSKRWKLALGACLGVWGTFLAQSIGDFREQTNVRVEYRFTQDFGVAFMGAAILTNDFHHTGFVYGDIGLGYKLTPNFSVNANYRMLFRRKLNGAYDKRHVLYADLDYSKSLRGPWIVTGTLRLQRQYFTHLFIESYRPPNFYARTRAGIRYKINYYWQPFTECELFTPLFSPKQRLPDQLRYAIGLAYTFNRHARVEIYEQIQRSLNTASQSIFFLTAINLGFRF